MDNKLAREFHTGSLIRFALPNIVMMVFMSLYTIVDGMFISRLVGRWHCPLSICPIPSAPCNWPLASCWVPAAAL